MSDRQTIDPWSVPLQGVNLIEASAGTGKTYSITGLYLRLLLERGLRVEQILVVTYTNAAAEELGERIRRRLDEALALLSRPDAPGEGDDTGLWAWLHNRPDPEADAVALRAALASLDQGAISTIHGLAQRVLREQAFDTGAPFEAELLEDEAELELQAVQDFWRTWMARAENTDEARVAVLAHLSGPEDLLKRLRIRLNDDELLLRPEVGADGKGLGEARAALRTAHQELCALYRKQGEACHGLMAAAVSTSVLKKTTHGVDAVAQAFSDLATLCETDEPPVAVGRKLELLTPERIADGTRKNQSPPEHPLFSACREYLDRLSDFSQAQQAFLVGFLHEARTAVRQRLGKQKRQLQLMGFDDLLTRLADALEDDGGGRLVQLLRQRFPVALIDEFQDTDPVQYRIFSRLYRDAGEGHGLFLIGDPKQAIYGFRGGDIFTYLAAVRDAGARYSLKVNWRSGSRLIKAFNTLFGSRDDAFVQQGINYQPVEPSPKADAEVLRIDGEEPIPLQFWRLRSKHRNKDGSAKAIPVGEAQAEAADLCARHIAWLLDGHATLGERPLRGGEIALLVRTHKEAERVARALADQGIACVTLGRDSVFDTPEATALLDLLQALAACDQDCRLRAALAGDLLARDASELDRWQQDEAAWERVQSRFFEYHHLWETHGFIQAFMRLFHQEGLAGRLLADAQGARRLTNLLQLVELCQHATARHPGMEALLRWLEEQIRLAPAGEAERQRLESDADLVQVVTMHASKGLEYPVVYIPFPWSAQDNPKGPFLYHDGQGRTCLYLDKWGTAREEVKAAWKQETLAEAMRLLYVAATRAAKLCVLPWGRVNKAGNSALASLLHGGRLPDEAAIFERLEQLAETCPEGIMVSDPPRVAGHAARGDQGPGMQARPFQGRIDTRWRVSSYSGLISGRESERPDFDFRADEALQVAPDDPIQALPASSHFGTFIHGLLECTDFPTFDPEAAAPSIERLALRHGLPLDPVQRETVAHLVQRVLDTPLPGAGLALRELPRSRRRDEMEFHFRVRDLHVARLREALAGHPGWERATEHLDFAQARGLLHGFIDLVFEHQGRYHLADYKSNRLDAYGAESLEQAMQAHHYPLQGLIYALALHRHLRQRLPGYDPARHLGGVHYLFLRGMRPGGEQGIWQRPITPGLIAALEQAFDREAAA